MALGAPFSASNVFADDVVAALRQHLNVTSSGIRFLFDQCPQKFIFGFAGCGESDFDFFETEFDEKLEKSSFSASVMGTIRLWFPSRRSTLHQIGAFSMWSLLAQRISQWGGGCTRDDTFYVFHHSTYTPLLDGLRGNKKPPLSRRFG